MPRGAKEPDAFTRSVAAEIRAVAGRKGLRQFEVAEKAGISRSTFGPLWKGDRIIDVDQLARIAAALGVQPNTLVQPGWDDRAKRGSVRDADDSEWQVAAYESPEPKGLAEPEQP